MSAPRVRCAIGLGSNLGDRSGHLRFAVRRLAALPGTRVERVSPFHRTAPVGPRQPDFLNAAALLRTRLGPTGLFVELKRIEALRGRSAGRRWGPRPLDCDLLFYGDERLSTRLLEVPHPEALRRSFVLAPLADLLPSWTPPVRPRRTVAEWLGVARAGAEKVKWKQAFRRS